MRIITEEFYEVTVEVAVKKIYRIPIGTEEPAALLSEIAGNYYSMDKNYDSYAVEENNISFSIIHVRR